MAAHNGDRTTRRKGSTANGKPAWQRITKRQRERFLELVREGLNRAQATSEVKAPKGSFRALCTHDPLFEAAYLAAAEEHREDLADQLRGVLVACGLRPESDAHRDRVVALKLFDPEARAILDTRRMEVTGKDGGPLEHRMFDPTKLSDDELEALERLLRTAAIEE